MECCLIRTMLLLLPFSIILSSAQHHHGHHSRPGLNDIANNINDNKIDSDLPLSSQNSDVDNHIDAAQEDSDPAIARGMSNHSIAHGHMDASVPEHNHTHGDNSSSKHVECVCALFSIKSPIENDVPLMSKTVYNVSCHGHASGEDACTKVCISFAASHYKSQDNIICSLVQNATDLIGFLHSKICLESAPWTFTGIQTPKPLCCNDGEPIECEKNAPHTFLM